MEAALKKEYKTNIAGVTVRPVREVFRILMEIALAEGCERLEWMCLNWNEPSIAFYKKMGAFPLSDWTTWRMTAEDMKRVLYQQVYCKEKGD